MREKSAHPGVGGGARPPPFTILRECCQLVVKVAEVMAACCLG